LSERVYAGRGPVEREALRREQLLAAALEVFGTTGWSGSTVQDVCSTARLSTRYFYELVDSREDLFLALIRQLATEVEATVLDTLPTAQDPQGRAAAVLAALHDYFTEDPRRIRVALMESLATEQFRHERRRLLLTFSELGARLMRPLRPAGAVGAHGRRRLELNASLMTGALVEAFIAWEDEPIPREPLLQQLTALYTAASRTLPA
jgi:AcrR family transcriptional regulator